MIIPVLTIDGPSGAGKGTISKAIAQQLGWHYLDSGAIYRAVAIAVLQNDVDLADATAVADVAQAMQLQFDCSDSFRVLLAEQDITLQLGLEEIGLAASTLAAYPMVRAVLLQKQRDFQQAPGLVADGRDMGTVVFPGARYKVFLTANAATRAQRRYKQLKEKGINANLIQIISDIEERDRRDRERASSPLVAANDALVIDSSLMTVDAVIAKIMDLMQ